ncbi:MAG: hypothetical protein ACTSU5_12105 [Promethearchaeota archaeon]
MFHFPLACLSQRDREKRHRFTKNGHDTSVKGHPQQFRCKACKRNFYAHTSAFFRTLFKKLKRLLKKAFEGGRLDLQQLAAKFNLDSG